LRIVYGYLLVYGGSGCRLVLRRPAREFTNTTPGSTRRKLGFGLPLPAFEISLLGRGDRVGTVHRREK
jgi:hypothetical protein